MYVIKFNIISFSSKSGAAKTDQNLQSYSFTKVQQLSPSTHVHGRRLPGILKSPDPTSEAVNESKDFIL